MHQNPSNADVVAPGDTAALYAGSYDAVPSGRRVRDLPDAMAQVRVSLKLGRQCLGGQRSGCSGPDPAHHPGRVCLRADEAMLLTKEIDGGLCIDQTQTPVADW